MQKQAYDFLYKTDHVYWYQEGLSKLVENYVSDISSNLGQRLRILDVGSGIGGMSRLLRKYGELSCLELSDYAVQLCHRKYPDVNIKLGSANNLSELFPESSFDLVTFLNVLYHSWINDDAEVLKQAAYILKPVGRLILVEPAFNCLYRSNDKFCYGVRRYTKKRLSYLLSQAGLILEESTYFNSISFLPLLLSALLQRFRLMNFKYASYELQELPRFINEFLKKIMYLERICITALGKMPFGVSLLCVAKKP